MELKLRLILIVASIVFFILLIKKIRKSKMRIDDAVFWILTSVFFLLMAVFPVVPIYIAKVVGIESPANLVFLTVFGLMFVKLFSLSVLLSSEVEKRSELVRYIALLEKNRQRDGD